MENGKSPINYLFFSALLLFLLALTFSHFIRMNGPVWGAPLYFLLYALGQSLLEVFCFILIGFALHRWMPRWTFKVYTGLSCAILLAHFANYTLVRLMDVSLSYFFKFFFGCGLEHFRLAFLALNLNGTITAIIIGAILLIPLCGIGFYWLTHKISIKKPLILSQKQILSAVGILSAILLLLDMIAKPYLTNAIYNKYIKTLPLCSTFLSPSPRRVALSSCLKKARDEKELAKWLASDEFSCKSRPNVYLFVIETLRRDFVNFETAPNMSEFASQNLAPSLTFSNANSTHLSWFAIFHSNYPFYWTDVRDGWTQGSIPLQIFKKMGYKIRAYSSASLSYFNMDRIIFGHNHQIADSIQDFSCFQDLKPCDRDALAIDAALKDSANEREGTLFLVFLDATHSEYSSPDNFPHPFQPAAVSIDYLAISQSSCDLELLKNRYRNAIHWVDHLIGKFCTTLKEEKLYDSSLIAITGDHGEEFFEDGALFHGSHLNLWQTKIPLFYKFPGAMPGPAASMTTHIDIFPSILHFLTGNSSWGKYCDGLSVFATERWPYALIVQHNGPQVPFEFLFTDGKNRMIARFLNPPFIHSIPGFELLSLGEMDGENIDTQDETSLNRFSNALKPLTDQ